MMKTLDSIRAVYFIGIGGIGMSALARYFHQKQVRVSGYDKTPTALTAQLMAEGIPVHFDEQPDQVDQEADCVVYTPAIPDSHLELVWYRAHDYPVLKRSDILQMIASSMQAVCIAGTHGKTTISTMTAHLLRESGTGCNAFLGGISVNYQSNYWADANPLAVIEADEYDRSFLKLHPYISVVSAMDADHLDIYGTVEVMERCYLQFISQTTSVLIHKYGLKHASSFKAPQQITYSLQNPAADYYASDIRIRQGSYSFTCCKREEVLGHFDLAIGGMHNIENAIAALAVCDQLHIPVPALQRALADFKGVKRRFEYICRNTAHVYIDDYAHHPEELRMLLQSARTLFEGRKLSVLFQPHLYTRTRDLCEGFAGSLDLADEVVLLDIYPARELPIPGVSSQLILDQMSLSARHLLSRTDALNWIEASQPELLITAGAGDIDQLVEPIKQLLTRP